MWRSPENVCGVLKEKCAPHRLGRLNSCSQLVALFGEEVHPWGGHLEFTALPTPGLPSESGARCWRVNFLLSVPAAMPATRLFASPHGGLQRLRPVSQNELLLTQSLLAMVFYHSKRKVTDTVCQRKWATDKQGETLRETPLVCHS